MTWTMARKLLLVLCVVSVFSSKCALANNVHNFEMRMEKINQPTLTEKSDVVSRNRRDTADAKCQKQETDFLQEVKNGALKLEAKYKFQNETNFSMALAWAGIGGGLMIVTTEEQFGSVIHQSNIYRSDDYGQTFKKCEGKVAGAKIRKHNGLQRNPHDSLKLYLIGTGSEKGSSLYITEDGGKSFVLVVLDFHLDGEIMVHPDKNHDTYLLASSSVMGTKAGSKSLKTLHVSKNNGRTWNQIASYVQSYKWGTVNGDTPTTIYASIDPENTHPFLSMFVQVVYELRKTVDCGDRWDSILNNVVSFGHQEQFLYASVFKKEGKYAERLMKVSTDGGKTWNEAQLPTLTGDRFYSVLDMRESLVFMHVDNPGDTGHGTLFTSGKQGIIYSESLQKHLYPNYGDVTDFYRVDSLTGVYIASQMRDDNSIQSVITYNRGGNWQPIPRPVGVPCKDETKACNLQIHGTYSLSRGVTANPPLSVESAVGIILVHGHVANALQTTPPDVFITSDGGYTWRKALTGPHHYQIADSGSLIVAVPASDNTPKVLKFSTDEGQCWHEYQFIQNDNDSIIFTGLLTEPGSKSLTVSIWGYHATDRKWATFVVDFQKVFTKQCGHDDYETWMAHSTLRKNEPAYVKGCLLGRKEVFQRLKKDSWCFNGYKYQIETTQSTCLCTREDYECDYGYFRPEGKDDCNKIKDFRNPEIDICLRGHEEKIVTKGYRKIPGDKCSNGFVPTGELINLNKHCAEGKESKLIVQQDETTPRNDSKNTSIPEVDSTNSKVDNTNPKVDTTNPKVDITNPKVDTTNPEVETTTPEVVTTTSKPPPSNSGIIAAVVIIVLLLAAVMVAYFVHKYIIIRRHKVVYRYSLLQQDDGKDNAYENALAAKPIVYEDSSDDEELNSPAVPRNATNGNPFKQPKAPVKSYHDDSDVDMLS